MTSNKPMQQHNSILLTQTSLYVFRIYVAITAKHEKKAERKFEHHREPPLMGTHLMGNEVKYEEMSTIIRRVDCGNSDTDIDLHSLLMLLLNGQAH